MPFYCKSEQGR